MHSLNFSGDIARASVTDFRHVWLSPSAMANRLRILLLLKHDLIQSLGSLCTANCGSSPSFVNARARHEREKEEGKERKRKAAAAPPQRITHECLSFPKKAERKLPQQKIRQNFESAIFLLPISFNLIMQSRKSELQLMEPQTNIFHNLRGNCS